MSKGLRTLQHSTLEPTWTARYGWAALLVPMAGFILYGASYIAGAVALAAATASVAVTAGKRITFDASGVRSHSKFRTRSLSWDDITHYTYSSRTENGIHSAEERELAGKHARNRETASHSLVLHGERTRIEINSWYRDAPEAIAAILPLLHALFADTRRFGPFDITDAGLHHDEHGTLPWSQLEVVRLRGSPAYVEVMKHGKAFPWARHASKKLANVLLFLERLDERGVHIDLGDVQFATPRLIESDERRKALPRAEVRSLRR